MKINKFKFDKNKFNKERFNLKDHKRVDFTGSYISKIFGYIGLFIDWIFSKNLVLFVISIFASIAMFIYVLGLPDQLDLINSDTRTIEEVPIEVLNNDEASKIIKVYDADNNQLDKDDLTADIILRGPRNEVLKVVNNIDEYNFVLDTSVVANGDTSRVYVTALDLPNAITMTSAPTDFIVSADKLVVNDEFILVPEAANLKQLGKNLTIENISLSSNEVHVSGSELDIETISTVKALVDVSSIGAAGTYTFNEDNIVYRAYSDEGEVVDVGIDTKDVEATVVVSDYNKEVPVNVIFKGEMPKGKSIGEYKLSSNTIKLYGDKSNLDNIDSIDVVVQISDLEDNNKVTVDVDKPNGVISTSEDTITVEVPFEDTQEITIKDIPIGAINLGSNLNVQGVGQDSLTVDVKVQGAPSTLAKLTAEDIEVQVDLNGLGVGKHTVQVEVVNKDSRLNYTVVPAQVTIQISES